MFFLVFLVCAVPASPPAGAQSECRDPNGLVAEVNTRSGSHPPVELVSSITRSDGVSEWTYEHRTDGWFDSAGFAGRVTPFAVTTPPGWDGSEKLPLLVVLHGGCGGYRDALGLMPQEQEALVLYLDDSNPPNPSGQSGCVVMGRIHHLGYFSHHEPRVTGLAAGAVFVDYTRRRHSFERSFAIDEFNADQERVFLVGHSKGGAGVLYQALLEPDVFAGVFADVPRVNLPVPGAESNQACNSMGRGWQSHLDTALLCESDPRCLDLHIFTWSGRDDRAARWCFEHGTTCGGVDASDSWLERMLSLPGGLQGYVWDESGHDRGRFGVCVQRADKADPVLGCRWHDSGWEPMLDEVTFLRRDLSFPGFRRFSADQDPGAHVEDQRCNGEVEVAGDTGCINGGELAGAINRFLRWDSASIKDKKKKWSATMWIIDDPAAAGVPGSNCRSAAGYPTCFDDYPGIGVETVDVSPRRVQAFDARAGDTIKWKLRELGDGKVASGKLVVGADGVVVVPDVELSSTAQRRLKIRRTKRAADTGR